MTDRLFKVTHKVGPNTRVRTILALVFLCPGDEQNRFTYSATSPDTYKQEIP